MKKQFKYIKPFLIFLEILPETLYNIGNETIINTDIIPMDDFIVSKLRNI